MILKSEESVPVSLPARVLSADHALLSSTVTIKEGSDCPEFIIIKVQRVFCTHCGRTHALLPDLWLPCSPVPVSLVSVIASLSHHQFSAFQNTFYPLTDRFLYSLIKRFRKISQDAHPLLRIFYLYQHDGDTFFLLNTSSIDKYNMPL